MSDLFTDGELAEDRAMAEARMLSRCTVRRDAGLGTQDPVTGVQPRLWDVIYTDLPMRLGGSNKGSASSRTLSTSGGDVEVPVRVASFPVTTDLLADGDLIEITSGENAGMVLRVVEAEWQDQSTARRVPVIGARRPDEWDEEES